MNDLSSSILALRKYIIYVFASLAFLNPKDCADEIAFLF